MPVGYDTCSYNRDTEFGALKEHFWSWSFAAPFHISSIDDIDIRLVELSYTDMPERSPFSDSAVLATTVNRYIKDHKDVFVEYLIPPENLMFSGYPGTQLVAEKDAGKTVNQIFFVKWYKAHERLYMLRLVAYKDKYEKGEVDSFFKSFKISY